MSRQTIWKVGEKDWGDKNDDGAFAIIQEEDGTIKALIDGEEIGAAGGEGGEGILTCFSNSEFLQFMKEEVEEFGQIYPFDEELNKIINKATAVAPPDAMRVVLPDAFGGSTPKPVLFSEILSSLEGLELCYSDGKFNWNLVRLSQTASEPEFGIKITKIESGSDSAPDITVAYIELTNKLFEKFEQNGHAQGKLTEEEANLVDYYLPYSLPSNSSHIFVLKEVRDTSDEDNIRYSYSYEDVKNPSIKLDLTDKNGEWIYTFDDGTEI